MSNGLFDVLSLQGITFLSTNVSSEVTAGFEEKDDRHTAYIHITESELGAHAYMALALGTYTKNVTAAQAKKLQGVTAGERVNIYAELFIDSLSGDKEGSLQIEFFNESGTKQGETTELSISEADEWEQFAQGIIVPTGATRVNFYVHCGCGVGETVQIWIANIKITRG